ncbi:MAG: hypothetical protein ACQESN_11485, partial [Thermotogota bacterium]
MEPEFSRIFRQYVHVPYKHIFKKGAPFKELVNKKNTSPGLIFIKSVNGSDLLLTLPHSLLFYKKLKILLNINLFLFSPQDQKE